METRRREYSLDFLKVIATLSIVLHHYQQVYQVTFSRGINFYGGKFYFGYIVELFFVISGFFVTGYTDQIKAGLPFSKFFRKKYLRFQPLMAISVITFSLLCWCFERVFLFPWKEVQLNFWGIVTASLGIQAGWAVSNPGINNPIWYISVLLLCYNVFFLVVFISEKMNLPREPLFAFTVLFGIGILTYNIDLPFLNSLSARGYYAFFWGVLLGEYLKKNIVPQKTIWLSLTILGSFPIMIACNNSFMENGLNYMMTFFYYTALILCFTKTRVKKLFESKIWKELADISYHVYIWHSCVFIGATIITFGLAIDPVFSDFKTVVCFILATYFIGSLSYLAEKSFKKNKAGRAV